MQIVAACRAFCCLYFVSFCCSLNHFFNNIIVRADKVKPASSAAFSISFLNSLSIRMFNRLSFVSFII